MKNCFITLIFFLSFLSVSAQKLKTVEGNYVYHASRNESLEQAEQTALYRAKVQAMAEEFGTIVSQVTTTETTIHNGSSNVDFNSVGDSEVKGEWIETIDEPTYDIQYQDGALVVTCHVKGKVREIVSVPIELKAKVLCKGTDDSAESDVFKHYDDMYLSFTSPVSGFLAVYLVDAQKQAYCLLPYRDQQEGIYPIKANRPYLFFKRGTDPMADEYQLTCDEEDVEYNRIYIIFSPKEFSKAVDNNGVKENIPRQLSYDEFNKWLVKHRRVDEKMNVVMKVLTIKKK